MTSPTLKLATPWCFIFCCLASPWTRSAQLDGTWEGTLVCDGTEYTWTLILQHQSDQQYQGESLLAAGDVTGHHRVRASLDSKKLLVKASGAGWIKALPGDKQVRFRKATLDMTAGTISGRVRQKNCEAFVLTRTSTTAALSSAPAGESKKSKNKSERRRRQSQRPTPAVDCQAVVAWSRIIEQAYPDADFNRRHYNRMSDLFLDEHFIPVFGEPFAAMDEATRKAISRDILTPCFRNAELEQAGNWQRRNLASPFFSMGREFSYDTVALHLQQRTANREWLVQASRTLTAGDGTDEQLRELAAEGRIRAIGLWPSEVAAFRGAVDQALGPTPAEDPDPGATHFVYPNGTVQPQDKIIPLGKSLGNSAGSMYACGFEEAIQFKTTYLEQVQRLAPTRLPEAENAFDESFEMTFAAEHRCPLREQLAAPHLSDVDNAYSRLDNLLNSRRSDARGKTRAADNRGVPAGFYILTLRNDDPDETYARTAAGKTLSGQDILAIGKAMGHSVINLRQCDTDPPEREYRARFVEEAKRLAPWRAGEAGKSFDRGVKSTPFGGRARRQPSQDPCAPEKIAQYQQNIADLFEQLASYSAATRATLVAEAEARRAPLEPGIHDLELFASIRGEVEEVNNLGRGLPALEAGVIWHEKYTRRYGEFAGLMYSRNLKYLMLRRRADAIEATPDLVAGLDAAQNDAEIDLFLSRYLGIEGDRSVGVAGRFFALGMTRGIEIRKQADYEQIAKRTAGAPKAAGAVGELEIMEAFVRSRWKSLNFFRILSPHSIGFTNPVEPFQTLYVTTVHFARAHQCEKLKAYSHRCEYSLRADTVYAPQAAGFKVGDDPFHRFVSMSLSAEADHVQDRFNQEPDGWYSPDMIERYREGLREAQAELQRQAEEWERNQIELPPDFP